MLDLVKKAVEKGAELNACISGGKDGQAMVKHMIDVGLKPVNLIHCDLGSVEWPESLAQCEKTNIRHNIPLHIIKRTDGRGLLEHWQNRMDKLEGQNKPFWSSSKNRYCTSDLKRDPADKFLRSRGNFVISCEGIRAGESVARSKKIPLAIRERITSPFYKGMTVEEAIANYNPQKRLALTWYPIFDFTVEQVWATYGNSADQLQEARKVYQKEGYVLESWKFHPAYVYGNERVSCMICIMGSMNDIANGIKFNMALYEKMVEMENKSGFSFKQNLKLGDFVMPMPKKIV